MRVLFSRLKIEIGRNHWRCDKCPISETPHHPHWFELIKWHRYFHFRTTGKPWKEMYDTRYHRLPFKRETLRIIREQLGEEGSPMPLCVPRAVA